MPTTTVLRPVLSALLLLLAVCNPKADHPWHLNSNHLWFLDRAANVDFSDTPSTPNPWTRIGYTYDHHQGGNRMQIDRPYKYPDVG